MEFSLPFSRDLSGRCEFAEEKLRRANEELEKAKESRESMYEKYVLSREEVKSQYEEKLKVLLYVYFGKGGPRSRSYMPKIFTTENCPISRCLYASLPVTRSPNDYLPIPRRLCPPYIYSSLIFHPLPLANMRVIIVEGVDGRRSRFSTVEMIE